MRARKRRITVQEMIRAELTDEELRKIRDEIDDEDLKASACSRLGHSYEIVGHGNESPSFGRGYRSSTHYKCRICGYEHTEVYEHDN